MGSACNFLLYGNGSRRELGLNKYCRQCSRFDDSGERGALLPFSADHHDAIKNFEIPHDLPIPKEIKSFIWMVSIGSCLAIIAETSVGDWSSIYLKEDLHLPIGVNTIGYSCFVLAQIISRFSVGRWIDLYGIPVVIRVGGLLGGFGVAPMPPSYVSVAGAIPGLPTTRALTRLAII